MLWQTAVPGSKTPLTIDNKINAFSLPIPEFGEVSP